MGSEILQKILIVDDDPEIIDIVAWNFEGVGIRTSVCESGEEAVEKMLEVKKSGGQMDLLTDLNGVDGIAVARRFRDIFPQEHYPNLRTFLMTASREAEIPDGLFNGMFYKPFDPKSIVEKIRNSRNLLAVVH